MARAKRANGKYYLKPSGRFSKATYEARRKGKAWSLGFEEYERLIQMGCHYCGGQLPAQGVGLDRVDSSLGYVAGNVVPCCTKCNHMKRDYSVAEFLRHVGRIFKRSVLRFF